MLGPRARTYALLPTLDKFMVQTLQALGELLLKSVPTIFFFILLNLYLKRVFFKPLARILEERKKATEGVRELAQRAFEAADKKTSEFEHALQLARAEIYQEHEALRRKWLAEQVEAVIKARADADHQIEEARVQIAAEAESAQAKLNASVDSLSEHIISSVLKRRAA